MWVGQFEDEDEKVDDAEAIASVPGVADLSKEAAYRGHCVEFLSH
jgi:hypothetical protein